MEICETFKAVILATILNSVTNTKHHDCSSVLSMKYIPCIIQIYKIKDTS